MSVAALLDVPDFSDVRDDPAKHGYFLCLADEAFQKVGAKPSHAHARKTRRTCQILQSNCRSCGACVTTEQNGRGEHLEPIRQAAAQEGCMNACTALDQEARHAAVGQFAEHGCHVDATI